MAFEKGKSGNVSGRPVGTKSQKILDTFKQTTDLFHRISLKTTDGVALGYLMTSQF
jgi:hypothetical protein